ncbi:MAG: hypothetical protein OXI97_07995 [Acidimicrobiaceae bacterium]|nr:hypothetical protein [Acidimicrobiaceae bacterium]
MKLFEQAHRFVGRAIFIAGTAGVAVFGSLLAEMGQAVGLTLMGAWVAVVFGSYALWRWRASQPA